MRTHVLIVLLAGVVLCNNVQGQTTDETTPQTTETKMTESTTQVSPDREGEFNLKLYKMVKLYIFRAPCIT